MFPPMGAAPSTNIHTASNPFYNMAAPSVAPSQQVPVSFTQGNRVRLICYLINLQYWYNSSYKQD